MRAIDIFTAALRIFGLWYAGRGFNDLLYVGLYVTGANDASVTKPFPGQDLVYGAAFFLIGLYFLRGAPLVVKFAYPFVSDRDEPLDEVSE